MTPFTTRSEGLGGYNVERGEREVQTEGDGRESLDAVELPLLKHRRCQ
jgi:hypothetical protein